MRNFVYKFCFFVILVFTNFDLNAEILKKIEVYGNERIVKETIVVYGEIEQGKDYSQDDIDNIIKKLYETKFFSKISIDFTGGILKINVLENPIINSIVMQMKVIIIIELVFL